MQQSAHPQRQPDQRMVERIEEVKAYSDEEIIALMWGASGVDIQVLPMEMTRRQIAASRDLQGAIRDYDRSARRASKWLIALTIAIVVLTVALIVIEVVRFVGGK